MAAGVEVVVVGGGIVGLATAMALAEQHGAKPLVLEAEARIATHQSSRNSGVVHTGLYYRPTSLKAALCAGGRAALAAFCREEAIPYHECGKVVVATREAELGALEQLARRGEANGVQGLAHLDERGIREHEPHASGLAGLWIPSAAVTDFGQVAAAMARRIVAAGGEVRTGSPMIGIARTPGVPRDRRGGAIRVTTPAGVVEGHYLVVCAGLRADRVARMCGIRPVVRVVPFRGDYYAVAEAACGLVRGLIYPVPDPRMPFLGVHLTRGVDGNVEAGPSAMLALRREGYGRLEVSLPDAVEMARFRGCWRLARRHWRTGLGEARRAFSKAAFAAEVRRLVPDLAAADLRRAPSGVRAQAVAPDGTLVDDFLFAEAEGMTHVLNAPSPAATASIAIGRHVAKRVAERMNAH